MKRLVSLGLCFTLSFVLVFGSVFSSFSIDAFANVPGGSMGGSAGDSGGSGGEDQNQGPETGDGGDGGGSGGGPETGDGGDGGDGRRSGNNDNSDNDNANDPRLTAKKIECPEGQEVPLFSATCDLIQPPANTQCDETAEQTSLAPSAEPSSSSSSQEGLEAEPGDVEFAVEGEGDYAQQCTSPLEFGNTGNIANPNDFLQYNSEPDPESGGVEFVPESAWP